MDISINTSFYKPPMETGGAAPSGAEPRTAAPALSVTTGRAAPVGDAEALENVSDEMLRRDDDLGKLLTKAFDLPAPDMPDFPQEAKPS